MATGDNHEIRREKAGGELFLSVRQMAARYGVGRTTVWRWVSEGRLPTATSLSPGCKRWKLSELEAFEAEL
ncbi:helix-turn-helix domain-containing protein [Halomonas sp. KAO]|uniref:helix-turn-helix transcriptional regulator n=1 Tax=Halomonas sp. KAO TaxID=2783858 RepID=UPI00189CA52E|nr:helix-turn-helix domain-containing protein [Halomonas sp. KAO]MBF7054790.1 helix-turn-helix domain-containing protein [Halomonas sp. KAO]